MLPHRGMCTVDRRGDGCSFVRDALCAIQANRADALLGGKEGWGWTRGLLRLEDTAQGQLFRAGSSQCSLHARAALHVLHVSVKWRMALRCSCTAAHFGHLEGEPVCATRDAALMTTDEPS